MSGRRTLRLLLILLLFVLLVGYLVFAVLCLRDGNPNEVCAQVNITIDTPASERSLTREDIILLLSAEGLYPEGKPMKGVRTSAIEACLRAQPLVRNVVCFKSANPSDVNEGSLCIELSLRQPVLHVLPEGGADYYVDDEGCIIPEVPRKHNLLTATGAVTTDYAAQVLAPFAVYVGEDSYWSEQLVQVHVETDRRGRPTVKLIPREGEQVILLGPIDGYEKKLRRMKVFYRQAIPQVGWTKYKAFNLEYDNQIVCIKK